MSTRLYLIAIVPAAIIVIALYLSDRYDREPFKLLLKTYVFGALAVIPTIFVEEILNAINIFPGVIGAFYTAFIVAGLTEEYFKRLVVLKTSYNKEHFNEKLDGIVYAVFSSMGFATVENIIYVVYRFSYNPYIGLYRGILSVPAHGIFAVTMGYYLSLAKYATNEKRRVSNMRKSLYMPMLFHGIYDFILMANLPQLTIIFLPYVVYLWWLNQKKLRTYLYDSKSRFIGKKKERE